MHWYFHCRHRLSCTKPIGLMIYGSIQVGRRIHRCSLHEMTRRMVYSDERIRTSKVREEESKIFTTICLFVCLFVLLLVIFQCRNEEHALIEWVTVPGTLLHVMEFLMLENSAANNTTWEWCGSSCVHCFEWLRSMLTRSVLLQAASTLCF